MQTIGLKGKPMITVYVVWRVDGPLMTTLLQYEDEPDVWEAMSSWNTDQWVSRAYRAEFGGNLEGSYELAAIFIADNATFIY